MFSGNAVVITVRAKFGVLSSDNPSPQRLAERFQSINGLANTAFDKRRPLTTRNVADVFQAVFESKPGIFVDLISTVKALISEIRAQLLGDVDDHALPISCGIAAGHVVFDHQLLIGDPLVEAEVFTEEAIRRNCLLVVDAHLLPDIYASSDGGKIKNKQVVFFTEQDLLSRA